MRGVAVRDGGDTGPGAGQANQDVGRVRGGAAARKPFPVRGVGGQGPTRGFPVAPDQAQGPVAEQIVRGRRIAMLGQVARGCVEADREERETARREQRIVRQCAGAHRDVEALAE